MTGEFDWLFSRAPTIDGMSERPLLDKRGGGVSALDADSMTSSFRGAGARRAEGPPLSSGSNAMSDSRPIEMSDYRRYSSVPTGSNGNVDAADAASRDDSRTWSGGPGPPDCPASAQQNLVEKNFETRIMRTKTQIKATIQGRVYNFLERPTGWKCFVYHFTV